MQHILVRRLLSLVVSALALAAVLSACVIGPEVPRVLSVAPTAFTLSPSDPSRQVAVSYSGPAGSSLAVTATVSGTRVSVSPAAVTVAAGETVPLTITGSFAGLDAAVTRIVTLGGQQVEPVTVTVQLVPPLAGCFIDPETAALPAAPLGARHGPASSGALAYRPDQLLVRYRASIVTRASVAALGAAQRMQLAQEVALGAGVTLLRAARGGGHDLVGVPDGDLDAAEVRLLADPRVELVSRNYILRPLQAVDDEHYGAQWHLYDFGVEEAWEIEDAGGAGQPIVIAVLDNGFNIDHVNLAAKMLPGRDAFCEDDDVRVLDAHGTHVAAIAGAGTAPGGVVVGVALGELALLLPVKVFEDTGEEGTLDSLLRGLEFAADLDDELGFHADIINMSLGFGRDLDPAAVNFLQGVIDEIHDDRGIVIIAAAGNDGATPAGGTGVHYPARLTHVLAVGSVDWEFTRSDFSTHGEGLDVMAPGGLAPQAQVADDACYLGGIALVASAGIGGTQDVACLVGTSMASPFVAGVVSLLMAFDPSYRGAPEDVAAALIANTLHPDPGNTEEYGHGIVCPDLLLGNIADTATSICSLPIP